MTIKEGLVCPLVPLHPLPRVTADLPGCGGVIRSEVEDFAVEDGLRQIPLETQRCIPVIASTPIAVVELALCTRNEGLVFIDAPIERPAVAELDIDLGPPAATVGALSPPALSGGIEAQVRKGEPVQVPELHVGPRDDA